jgi:alanyl-tRNA synthetase
MGENEMAENTKCLYFEDPYRIEFEARVIHRLSLEGNPAVVLDQTCFYPEGGGQPADKGTLEEISVIHVLERDGQVVHVLEKEISSETVRGKIDWDVRFDHMQQHAGQHVLSQCFVQLFDASTRSFHLGEKISTLEVDMRNISENETEQVEKHANKIVFQNRNIESCFYNEEDISEVQLRRPTKKKGNIRVVAISEFDQTACGGTHPSATGEIGMIKILKWDKIRNNVRLEFICGNRALEDYIRKHRDLRELSNRLTVDDSEVMASFEKLVSDLKSQKKINRRMLERIIQFEAAEIINAVDGKIVKKIFFDRAQEEIRQLALTIMREEERVVLFGLDAGERCHVFLACSEKIGIDMRELVPVISPMIQGRGGGRPSFVELSGENKKGLEKALDKAQRFIHI